MMKRACCQNYCYHLLSKRKTLEKTRLIDFHFQYSQYFIAMGGLNKRLGICVMYFKKVEMDLHRQTLEKRLYLLQEEM